jgi:hypothetical protein
VGGVVDATAEKVPHRLDCLRRICAVGNDDVGAERPRKFRLRRRGNRNMNRPGNPGGS